MPVPLDIAQGVTFSVEFLQRLSQEALKESPTCRARSLCLSDAAERLQREAGRPAAPSKPAPTPPPPADDPLDLFATTAQPGPADGRQDDR
ncbi:hypothetical protein ABMY26_23715 [Azospirillum sp. HJ39]|uniref:hypothetical protein n=1 Tax=Azospirillum sp. HJ39 TaxID=3159496 RepID=UPI0035570FF2